MVVYLVDSLLSGVSLFSMCVEVHAQIVCKGLIRGTRDQASQVIQI